MIIFVYYRLIYIYIYMIENRFVFQLLAQNYGIIIIK